MVAEESNGDEDVDHDGAETLSLCDLVETSSSNWSNNDDSSSFKESGYGDQGFFEFFSEDFTAASPASAYPKADIIFCGKLIPYEQEAAENSEQTQKQNRFVSNGRNHMTRSTSSKAPLQHDRRSCRADHYRALSQRKGSAGFSSAAIATTSAKPRWYLLAFGHGRFPPEMKLRDIRNRQGRRRAPAMMFQSDGGGEVARRSSEKSPSSSPWKGFWTLLEVLGCKSQQANAVVRLRFN